MTPTVPSLPQGWEERQDANGRTYYVNHVCKYSIYFQIRLKPIRKTFMAKRTKYSISQTLISFKLEARSGTILALNKMSQDSQMLNLEDEDFI